MQALAFWKAVTEDRVELLDRIFELLDSAFPQLRAQVPADVLARLL